ncbi:FHA domain-containing protein [Corallococcus praedator]|uniref:FHA domain-containing protein n=1 Tax=Corallococcus praedator TaxID=2316724 RepID=A0ABX9QAU9_9BACT|nr:FHA domain-containing protein [Corallococcus sp. CA047B]RKH26810.1 FHA domain-containing protein [Corallococcus sp. CA031C]RKH99121.1 FHA domain-containing protein [Corallococcus praedator]
MPPRRPSPSSRSGTGRSGGSTAERRPKSSSGGDSRRVAVPDEDWSAPPSGEDGPDDGGDPELYGEAEPQRSRTGETRVASVADVRPDPEEASEEEDEDNSETTRAGPPVLVLVLDGPDKGRKKRFKGVRMVLGRSKDCDFALGDQTVSRRHIELVYGASGVVMRDLGGISGTQVNDQKVDECILKHGDEISVGKTRLRFVDEGELIKEMRAKAESGEEEPEKKKEEEKKDPRLDEKTNANYKLADLMRDEKARKSGVPRPRPVRSSAREGIKFDFKMKVGAAVAGLVVVLMMVGLATSGRGGPPPPPPEDPGLKRATELMQKARDKVRDGEYPDAVRFAAEAEKAHAGIDADGVGKGAQRLQDVVEGFKEIRGLIAENKYDDARARLKDLPEGTARTDAERDELKVDLETKEQAYHVGLLETALTARDAEQARTLIPLLVEATRPPYETRLAELDAALAKEAAQAVRQAGYQKAAAAESAKQRRAQYVEQAFEDVERRFNGGDFQRATLEVDRVMEKYRAEADVQARARNLKKLIPQFRSAFEEGQKKYESNALEASVKPLRRAAEVYRQIGFAGSLGDTLDNELASASVAAGQSAFKRKEYPVAGRSFREALRLNPGDSRARTGLDELQKKVEELYLSAYIARDRDPALAKEQFKIVIEASAEGSDVKRKAEMALSELQKSDGS